MSYRYIFSAGTTSHQPDQFLYQEKANSKGRFFATESEIRSEIFPVASKYSFKFLNDIKPICTRIHQEKLSGGFFKAEGDLLFNKNSQYKVGIQCDKDYVYSYFQQEGTELISTIHSSYDNAVTDFLSHLI